MDVSKKPFEIGHIEK